jgi:hypothetical protein
VTRRPSRWPAGLAACAAALLLAGCARTGGGPAGGGAQSTTTAGQAAGAAAAGRFRTPRGYEPTPRPSRIAIPRIGVDSGLVRLGRAADGTVEVPARWEVAGWYAPGPSPGDPGSAVILGHVDSTGGPAVFYRLRQLRPGDRIQITRADGAVVRFTVERTGTYDKRRFPTDDVYYPILRPELRLVTCGGSFDPSAGHYRSNIIVFASLAS